MVGKHLPIVADYLLDNFLSLNKQFIKDSVKYVNLFSFCFRYYGGNAYLLVLYFVSGVSRAKIEEVTLNALRTRQSLVKGERLVRHEMRAVMNTLKPTRVLASAPDIRTRLQT